MEETNVKRALCLFALLLLVGIASAADFTINDTAGFDAGTKSSTATITDEYIHTANACELSYPYSKKDATVIGYWTLNNNLNSQVGTNLTWLKGAGTQTFTGTDCWNDASAYYLAFNGATWYRVDDTNSTNFNMGNSLADSPFSVSFWVWRTSTLSNYGYVGKGNMNTPLWGWQTYSASNRFREYCADNQGLSGAYEGFYAATGAEGIGAWIHIVYTYDGRGGTTASAGMNWYKNGQLMSKTNDDYGTYVAMDANVRDMQLGCINNGADGASNILNGRMNEVKIYKGKTLTLTEIQALYNGRSKYKTSGTWTSATQTMTAGYRMLDTTITYSGVSATNYISKIEWRVGGVVKATYDTAIKGGTSMTIGEANLTSGTFNDVDADFTVKIYLISGGTGTPTITEISGNYEIKPPATDTPEIFPTPVYSNSTVPPYPYNYNASTMNCSTVCTMGLAATLYANFTWYQNDNPIATYDTQVSCVNATTCYTDKLVNETLVVGDEWICSAICYDDDTGIYSDDWENSSTETIEEWPTPSAGTTYIFLPGIPLSRQSSDSGGTILFAFAFLGMGAIGANSLKGEGKGGG